MNRAGSCLLSLAVVVVGHDRDAAAQAQPASSELTAPAAAERNPFACYGGWQAATGNRTTRQMRLELLKRIDRFEESEAPGDRALDACVVGMLEQRLGIDDANDWFAAAVRDQPDEPGYELFWGMYWAMARGAHDVPVRDRAGRHLRRALAKLDRLRRAGALDEPHEVVADWTQKRLLVLHQQDGLALVPWSAFPYEPIDEWVPQVFASSQALASVDTRGFYHESAMRTFTGEEAFAESDVRAARRLTPRERWDLARAPLRVESDSRLRVGIGPIGAFDVFYDYFRAPSSQVTSFYAPTAAFNDVTVEQLGAGYERVFALDPLFDLRLAGSIRRVRREGLIEFLPDRRDEFNQVEVRPSVARFFGPDKLTLGAVYVGSSRVDLQACKLEYSIVSPK